MEESKWKPFRNLLNKKDRKMFDEMFSISRLYNSACVMAARQVVIHSILMSILHEHHRKLKELEKEAKQDE